MEKKEIDRKQKWALANKEKVRAAHKRYREKNKEKLAIALKSWRKRRSKLRNAQARREYEKRKAHYSAVVRKAGDANNPGRPIRRLARQFRGGSISRDELIEGIERNVSQINEA